MQVLVLPLLEWGVFGMEITPIITVATSVLHLVYATTLGWLLDRLLCLRGTSAGGTGTAKV